jgi:hypothetical protein
VITKFITIDYGHISYLGSFKWIQLHIIMRRWLRSELPLLVVVVYLPRIQILVGQSWAGTTLKGWPFGLSGRGSLSNYPCLRKEVAGSLHTNPWLVPTSKTRVQAKR